MGARVFSPLMGLDRGSFRWPRYRTGPSTSYMPDNATVFWMRPDGGS